MILAGFFIAELLLLFLLSRSLTASLARFFYALTRSSRVTIYLLAILFLPGTILHELAHLFSAGMLLVPVGRIEILPEIDDENVRLGSAEIGQTDLLRRMIIGMAPIIVGLLVIMAVLWLSLGNLSETTSLWQIILSFYVIFEVSNTMFSSRKDLEGAVAFLMAILVVGLAAVGVLLTTGNVQSLTFLNNFEFSSFENFLQAAVFLLLVPLGIDATFVGMAKLLNLKTT